VARSSWIIGEVEVDEQSVLIVKVKYRRFLLQTCQAEIGFQTTGFLRSGNGDNSPSSSDVNFMARFDVGDVEFYRELVRGSPDSLTFRP
jgi:hypothetical protein